MTIHCKVGDKNSIISYKFNGQLEKVVKINNAPIEVVITERAVPGSFTGGQCPDLYVIKCRAIARNGAVGPEQATQVLGPISAIEVNDLPTGYSDPFDRAWQLWVTCAGGGNYKDGISKTFIIYSVYGTGELLSIEPLPPNLDNCGDLPGDKKRCKILVSAMGNVLINEEGNCPVNYAVTCDEECPSGTVKCFSTNYPGYCCLPCEPTKQSIISIKNLVQSVNKEPVSYG